MTAKAGSSPTLYAYVSTTQPRMSPSESEQATQESTMHCIDQGFNSNEIYFRSILIKTPCQMREVKWVTWMRARPRVDSGPVASPWESGRKKSIYWSAPLTFSSCRLSFLVLLWSQIDASSLLRHFVFFTKSQCLTQNRCDSASHHRFSSSLLRRALFRSLIYRFIMFSRRSHYTEPSFSKHRATRAASKSKRSFQEHGTSTGRTRNKRPAGSPPTGR